MAKITPGPLAGLISGKVGNVVFSRGRYGPYIRSRVIPTLVQNEYTAAARGVLIQVSGMWGALADEEKEAWRTYAKTHPFIDRLGVTRTLQPSAVFIGINSRIGYAGGDFINVPPIATSPEVFSWVTIDATETGPAVVVEWPAAELAATEVAAMWLAVMPLGKTGYYRNRLKLVTASSAGEVSPKDITGYVDARFGAIVAGQILDLEVEKINKFTGLVSSRVVASTVVVA